MNEQDNNNNGAVDVENLSAEAIAEIEASDKFIIDFKDEDYNDPDKVEELRKHMEISKTTIHQKRHFRDKVTKLEEQLKGNGEGGSGKPKVEEKKPTEKKDGQDNEKKTGVDPLQVVTFRQDNPSYTKEMVAEISKLAGAFGVSMDEAAGSETGKAVIKNLENKNNNSNASLPPSKKAASGLEKRDWSNASPAEIEAQRNKILNGQ